MDTRSKYNLLRRLLKALGLSSASIDGIIRRIAAVLGDSDGSSSQPELHYQLKDEFLSAAELSFYRVLDQAVGEQWAICPKVSLSDLFFARSDDYRTFRTLTNKIDRKHVDFVLCDPATMRPQLCIELDDKSHQREDRQERDDFVNQVFANAGLRLLRIPAQRSYKTQELRQLVERSPAEPGIEKDILGLETEGYGPAPACPLCQGDMVVRIARKGSNTGKPFWGCKDFPRCRGLREVAQG